MMRYEIATHKTLAMTSEGQDTRPEYHCEDAPPRVVIARNVFYDKADEEVNDTISLKTH